MRVVRVMYRVYGERHGDTGRSRDLCGVMMGVRGGVMDGGVRSRVRGGGIRDKG